MESYRDSFSEMARYVSWWIEIRNQIEFHLFIDKKTAKDFFSGDTKTFHPHLSQTVTSIQEDGDKESCIKVFLGDVGISLRKDKFQKTVLFKCEINTTEDLLEFWSKHADFLRESDENGTTSDGSADLFEDNKKDGSYLEEEEQQSTERSNKKDGSYLEEEEQQSTERSNVDNFSGIERSHIVDTISTKKVAFRMLDIFKLHDPPKPFKVRDINKDFVQSLATTMVEKKSVSVDNAPTVVGMININLKDYKEEDLPKYKIHIIDGNHSVQAQKEAYRRTSNPLFMYRGVNIYCGLTSHEAVFLGVSRNEDTSHFCKFSDYQKVDLVRRRLYEMTNTPETQDPPKQPKAFREVFACLLNLHGKKEIDSKSNIRFLATSLSNKCYKLYSKICKHQTRHVPAKKFESLKGLDDCDIFENLKQLSDSSLDQESWHNFFIKCQEKQKKPKKLRKDVTVTFKFTPGRTEGFVNDKPMNGNCVCFKFFRDEGQVILTSEELMDCLLDIKPNVYNVNQKNITPKKSTQIKQIPSKGVMSRPNVQNKKVLMSIPKKNFKKDQLVHKDLKARIEIANYETRVSTPRKSKERENFGGIKRDFKNYIDIQQDCVEETDISDCNESDSELNFSQNLTVESKTSYIQPDCVDETDVSDGNDSDSELNFSQNLTVESKTSLFLSQMADKASARRAEARLCCIEEDEVETKPETLLAYSSVLLDPEVQKSSKPYFSSDAWLLVVNTLKVLEERFVFNVQRKFELDTSAKGNQKGKLLLGSKGDCIKTSERAKMKMMKASKRNAYSFTSEEGSPVKAFRYDRCDKDQTNTKMLVDSSDVLEGGDKRKDVPDLHCVDKEKETIGVLKFQKGKKATDKLIEVKDKEVSNLQSGKEEKEANDIQFQRKRKKAVEILEKDIERKDTTLLLDVKAKKTQTHIKQCKVRLTDISKVTDLQGYIREKLEK